MSAVNNWKIAHFLAGRAAIPCHCYFAVFFWELWFNYDPRLSVQSAGIVLV